MVYLTRIAAAVADALGRTVAPKTLTERQTDAPQLTPLHRTWGGHPVHGLTPERMSALLEGADSGDLAAQSELFLDMRDRDPHLDAEMGKRERAILTLPWSIEPPRNPSAREKRNAAAVGELIAAVPQLEDTFVGLMDAAGHGFACLELRWSAAAAGARLPAEITARPQSWFRLDRATRTELRLRDQSSDGAALWPLGWIVHRHAARAGYLHRAGLYRVLAWPWMLRQFSLRDLAEWLEIYGLPMRLGYYPAGAETGEKAALFRAVRDLGRHAAGIMPEGMRLDLLSAAEGQADPFMAMVSHAEACISRAILGGSLSSTPAATGLGSGVANLQGEVKRDLLIADARQVQATLTQDLVYAVAVLNGLADDPRRAPVLHLETREPADLTAFSQSLERLSRAGAGAMIPWSWVRAQTGIPEPVGDELTLGPAADSTDAASADAATTTAAPVEAKDINAFGLGMQSLSGAGLAIPESWVRARTGIPAPAGNEPILISHSARAPAAPAVATAAASQAPATLPPDYAEQHTAALARAAEPSMTALLGPIRATLDAALTEGLDLAAAGERLLTLYPRLPVSDFSAVLGEALTAADLAGRYDLEHGQ
ncbi:DUF935 family protein [uncultured Lamprocystis sp.]|jgi:phage gp29-like protein|uniref:DUF935 domain-containing protein n=1 Tax=uncultured Lamprocystis sp. TaxID=543132 RepID=UPI0025DECEC8|nr:DUF935 family protein [uncultured Lamprocystis sp.]